MRFAPVRWVDLLDGRAVFQFSPHEIQAAREVPELGDRDSDFQFSPHEILSGVSYERALNIVSAFNSLLMRFSQWRLRMHGRVKG